MKKSRLFVIIASVLCLAFGTIGLTGCGDDGGGDSGDVTEWVFYSPYGPEDSACCEIWPELFAQIEEETGGALKITTYWSGQHPYEGSDMLKVVSDNTAQLGHFYGGYVSSVDPAFGLDALPLLFPADSDKAWEINSELWGNFQQDTNGLLEKRLQEDWNASMVHMIPATSQRLHTVGFEAGTLDSLKGHKVRVYSAEFGEFVKALGGSPVTLAGSEVYTALSTNLIDSVITGIQFGYQSGYYDYCDTCNLWEISQSSDGMIVNLDALNALPEDVRDTFLSIMSESANKPEMLEVETCDKILKDLEAEGVTVVTPSDADREAIAKIMDEKVWTPWAEKVGDFGQELLDFVQSYK